MHTFIVLLLSLFTGIMPATAHSSMVSSHEPICYHRETRQVVVRQDIGERVLAIAILNSEGKMIYFVNAPTTQTIIDIKEEASVTVRLIYSGGRTVEKVLALQ